MPSASRAPRCTTPRPTAPKVSKLEGKGLPGADVFLPGRQRVGQLQSLVMLVERLRCLVGLNCPGDETSLGPGKSARTSQGILIIKTAFARHVPNRGLPEAKDKTRAGRPSQSLLDRVKVE